MVGPMETTNLALGPNKEQVTSPALSTIPSHVKFPQACGYVYCNLSVIVGGNLSALPMVFMKQ